MDVAIGSVFFAAGAILALLGVLHRRRARAAARPADDSAFGAVARGVVVTGVVLAGINIVLTYLAIGGGPILTLFGLAGFLCMLAGFAGWFVIRTRYPLHRAPGDRP